MAKKKEKKQKTELDTETTFADMNVEGFRWYNPDKKKGKKAVKLTKKEQRALIKGAYQAMIPMFCCIAIGFLFMMFIAWLWIGR